MIPHDTINRKHYRLIIGSNRFIIGSISPGEIKPIILDDIWEKSNDNDIVFFRIFRNNYYYYCFFITAILKPYICTCLIFRIAISPLHWLARVGIGGKIMAPLL